MSYLNNNNNNNTPVIRGVQRRLIRVAQAPSDFYDSSLPTIVVPVE